MVSIEVPVILSQRVGPVARVQSFVFFLSMLTTFNINQNVIFFKCDFIHACRCPQQTTLRVAEGKKTFQRSHNSTRLASRYARMTQNVARDVIARGGSGSIVNVSSISAHIAQPHRWTCVSLLNLQCFFIVVVRTSRKAATLVPRQHPPPTQPHPTSIPTSSSFLAM
jgi:hypothetical protein